MNLKKLLRNVVLYAISIFNTNHSVSIGLPGLGYVHDGA